MEKNKVPGGVPLTPPGEGPCHREVRSPKRSCKCSAAVTDDGCAGEAGRGSRATRGAGPRVRQDAHTLWVKIEAGCPGGRDSGAKTWRRGKAGQARGRTVSRVARLPRRWERGWSRGPALEGPCAACHGSPQVMFITGVTSSGPCSRNPPKEEATLKVGGGHGSGRGRERETWKQIFRTFSTFGVHAPEK